MKTSARNYHDPWPAGSARKLSAALGRELAGRGMRVATAESCSGGLIAHLLTNVPGSSNWFAGGVVAYANEVKTGVLHVPAALIAEHGAVSREVVLAMATRARDLLATDAALAVSGIAGPGGGSPDKPVGTVWMAWVFQEQAVSRRFQFAGTRLRIKKQTAHEALLGMLGTLQKTVIKKR